ncbi:MAG: lamin tail domain-containing protein [Tannerella sp.]|jgi:Na+-transporting methylmalonyl-CoA/oxaloacetate decarboxylase gamma subunit|nr:lamin tail domain-containing protein [Tannerella sp.]
MKRRRNGIGIAMLLMCSCTFFVQGQKASSVCFNEVLVVNESNFVDDYGERSGWIELYNHSPGTVNIGGCFLTNDRNNPRMYMIPKGDVLTKVPPRQHVLFWADGKASRGTFHVNFLLDKDKDNYLALYDVDGKTKIDEIIVPAGQRADVSFGLATDGAGKGEILSKATPSTNNMTLDTNEKIDRFRRNDAFGAIMTITAMAVVFIGLIVLYLSFKAIGKTAIQASQRRSQKAGHGGGGLNDPESGEVIAAIAAALYEVTEEDVHDLENTVLTIRKVARHYSPWNSKIYGLREPLKK